MFINSKFLCAFCVYILIILFCGQSELFYGGVFAPHDSFYPITSSIYDNGLGLFGSSNNFVKNVLGVFIHSQDILFIKVLDIIGIRFHNIQILHILFCYFLLFIVSYISFNKIGNNSKYTGLITLFYTLSPYLSNLYSGGTIYTISTIISIGLIPYFFYSLIISTESFSNFQSNYINIALMYAILSYGVLYLFPVTLTLLIYIGIYIFKYKYNCLKLINIKIISVIIILFVPFILFYIYNKSIIEEKDYLTGGMYHAIRGSIFFPLMQITSWAFYTVWSPRAVVNFEQYYFTATYNLLSLSIAFLFIYTTIKFKLKYLLLIFSIGVFFSKGANKPLGDIYLFIINYLPFGYMIRTPDTKFGIFISACYVLLYFFIGPKYKKFYLILMSLFLINNILGMYSNGVLSPVKGDKNTSYYLYDKEYKDIINLINKYNNHVVLTDHNNCVGKISNGKFYTCNDLVISGISKQVVGSDEALLNDLIEKYQKFAKIIYLNRNIVSPYKFENLKLLESKNFTKIYESSNYILYVENLKSNLCLKNYNFGCIHYGDNVLVSPPKNFIDYYYSNKVIDKFNDFQILKYEPIELYDYKKLIFILSTTLIYIIFLYFVIKYIIKIK